ncbi:hypothetical protein L226DRAFT_614998 [Lentinus tigrinus ALCF2SS1-7]|uniref:F-box domain-containing protein n=1 Tax=Lentinus tigrinus ALCF2SS1-6 TaxID=1328759 RepID=A0A5C2S9K7_9APHY|nr:hypothetical protein L227DRAFT_655031 [Lentinus tigrinus ALCF2SS1-6]RPD72294.1 hypothetical protein L226DRAFT_614998 [Lentinus tigrinus ALCF2SS1-7]
MDIGTAIPPNPLHKVLYNSDLLHEIFSHLHLPKSDPEPSIEEATLASAAQVCKTFTDPALAVLWESLSTLLPLWLLLEPLQLLEQESGPAKYILTDEISAANWSRFRHYAALIREVCFDKYTEARIDQSIWPHLIAQAGGELNLLPRLRSLSYLVFDPYQTSILLFLSPTLRKLIFYSAWYPQNWGPIERQEAAVNMLIRAACTNCPQLDDLKLSMLEFPGPLRVAAEGLKHRLRKLELGMLQISDAATIQALANISTLEQLHKIHVNFLHTQHLSIRGFRALKEVSIICDAPEDVSKFLACIVSPLESLGISSSTPSMSWRQEVKVIELSVFATSLLDLRNIEDASLLVRDREFSITSFSFKPLTEAWPRLTSFSFDGHKHTSRTPLPAHALFAKHCLSLHTLCLPSLNDRSMFTTAIDPGPLPPQPTLERLSFCCIERMQISDPETTGRAIWRLFPYLDVDACRASLTKLPPLACEHDCDEDVENYYLRMRREVGWEAWDSVLDVVEDLQAELTS